MPPGMERCILDTQSLQLVLEPRLKRVNINLLAIGFSEDPVGFPLLIAEKVIERTMEGNRPFFVALRLPETLGSHCELPRFIIDVIPFKVY